MTSEDDNGRELDAGSADYGELSICPDDYPLQEPCTAAETMLDRSMRTADQALRCYIEEYGEEAAQRTWHTLSAQQQESFQRMPVVEEPSVPSGRFFVRLFDGTAREISDDDAREHLMFALQAL
jgi:hypothetical protein